MKISNPELDEIFAADDYYCEEDGVLYKDITYFKGVSTTTLTLYDFSEECGVYEVIREVTTTKGKTFILYHEVFPIYEGSKSDALELATAIYNQLIYY